MAKNMPPNKAKSLESEIERTQQRELKVIKAFNIGNSNINRTQQRELKDNFCEPPNALSGHLNPTKGIESILPFLLLYHLLLLEPNKGN